MKVLIPALVSSWLVVGCGGVAAPSGERPQDWELVCERKVGECALRNKRTGEIRSERGCHWDHGKHGGAGPQEHCGGKHGGPTGPRE